jgi:hypothetical protein
LFLFASLRREKPEPVGAANPYGQVRDERALRMCLR